MFGFRLPYLPGAPFWAYTLAIQTLIAWPVAYYAKCKGYNFWVFLIVGALLNPLACLVLAIAIPKIPPTESSKMINESVEDVASND